MTTILLAGLGTPLVTYGLVAGSSPTPTPTPHIVPDPGRSHGRQLPGTPDASQSHGQRGTT
jgi:hypothetical protein